MLCQKMDMIPGCHRVENHARGSLLVNFPMAVKSAPTGHGPARHGPDRNSLKNLGESLDALYRDCDLRVRVSADPVRAPLRYKNKEDAEAAGFIAALMAYGGVRGFLPVIDAVLEPMGASPGAFLMEFHPKKQGKLFQGIKYRFSRTEDILCLLHAMGNMMRTHGSLEAAFMRHHRTDDPDVGRALAGFMAGFLGVNTNAVYGENTRPRGYRFFFPSPRDGSPCKRANLFLRWMVRRDGPDLGLWQGVSPSRLVIPLDTHTGRVSRCLGLTGRKADDWRAAVEITSALRAFDPLDPVKYDFALCHLGISGACSAARCAGCGILPARA